MTSVTSELLSSRPRAQTCACGAGQTEAASVFPLQAVADRRGDDDADHRPLAERSRDEDHLLQRNPLPHLRAHVHLSPDQDTSSSCRRTRQTWEEHERRSSELPALERSAAASCDR